MQPSSPPDVPAGSLRNVCKRCAEQATMTNAAAFLQAIREEPDDDALRLVFADWLDDNGQPEQAELIRLQCRLARLGEDDPECAGLERRQRELLTSPPPLANLVDDWHFERGLLHVTLRGDAH